MHEWRESIFSKLYKIAVGLRFKYKCIWLKSPWTFNSRNPGIDSPFVKPQFNSYELKNGLTNCNFGKKLNPVLTLYIPRDCNVIFSCDIKWHWDVDLF